MKQDKQILVDKYNAKLERLANKYKVPTMHLPKPISEKEAQYLMPSEINKMFKATTMKSVKDTKSSTKNGVTFSYSKAMLDVTNIRIKAENRKRAERRKNIEAYTVYNTVQTKKKGVDGAEENKYRAVKAGTSGQMADLSKAGLADLTEIKVGRGTVDVATKIRAHERAIDRDEAALYAENLKLSLLSTFPDNTIVPLIDILDSVSDEVLLEMYYSDTELSIPDWYIQAGRDEEELKGVLEKNIYTLEKWAKRLSKQGRFDRKQYSPLTNLRKKMQNAPSNVTLSERNVKRLQRLGKGKFG